MKRKELTVGILAETKNKWERRAPLSPTDIAWLVRRGIRIEVEASASRIYKDSEYRRHGAKIVQKFKNARLLVGIKEPPIEALYPQSVYMIFSHTTKGQSNNRKLLKAFLVKKITLIDYEHITGPDKQRLVFFGRFAGVCGMIDTLHVYGQIMKAKGIPTPFSNLKKTLHYASFNKAREAIKTIRGKIKERGFDKRISPFIVGITGHGNVSQGAQEILSLLGGEKIHPRNIHQFIQTHKPAGKKIYALVFQREEKLRSKKGGGFYFEEYLKNPRSFESNLDCYLKDLNILINASYWDPRYPRLLPEKMVQNLYKKSPEFRLTTIGDLSCDIGGTIEITKMVTTPEKPAYTYLPKTGKILQGINPAGIAIMATDNLPCELPKEATQEFSSQIRDYVYQIAAHGALDVKNHHALPREIREAAIAQGGKLTTSYKYLGKYLGLIS